MSHFKTKMADPQIDTLEDRASRLEKVIFGAANKDAAYPKIIDNLANVNGQVNSAVKGRPKIESVLKRLDELERYLDPAYTEALTLSREAKTEIILAEEDLILQQASNLKKIHEMSEVLGSEHVKRGKKTVPAFQAVPSLEGKLKELCAVHIQQQDQTAEVTDETKNLLEHYNSLITLLSKQFIQWDETITQLEIASQPKKVLD